MPSPYRPLLAILALALALPSGLGGQTSMLCSSNTPEAARSQVPALRFFSGEYKLPSRNDPMGDVSADSTNYATLDGLYSFTIPERVGYWSWPGGYRPDSHGNNAQRYTHLIDFEFRPESGLAEKAPDFLYRGQTAHWCVNEGRGGLYLRFGFQRDARWEEGGFLGLGERYVGVRVYPTLLASTTGLPVQAYSVQDRALANLHANEFYNGAARRIMAFSTHELEIWGGIRRDEFACRKTDPYGNVLLDASGKPIWIRCISYRREVTGRISRRLYQDARVYPGFTVGGAQFDLLLRVLPRTVATYQLDTGESDDAMEVVQDVLALCGTKIGCGGPPAVPLPPGRRHIPGDDDEARVKQVCRRMNDGRSCEESSNPLLPQTDLSTEQMRRLLEGGRMTGERATPQQRNRINSGQRAGGGADGNSDQLRRICRDLIVADSVRHVKQPIPADANRQTYSLPPWDPQVPAECAPFLPASGPASVARPR
jgi:hypothetical protein